MKLHQNLLWGVSLMVLFTGCIDNNYDLSDIDTTSEFKVNDLVIPINLEPVVLSDIIKVKEGDKLKEVTINGQTFYAVEQSGEFHSDGITVNSFSASPDPMEDKEATFTRGGSSAQSKVKRNAGEGEFEIFTLLDPVEESLEYSATGVDGSVRDLTYVKFEPLDFTIDISTSALPSDIQTELENVVLMLPKGLTVTGISAGGENLATSYYKPGDGMLEIPSVKFTDNATNITVTATAIDLTGYDNPFVYDADSESGTFLLNSQFSIEDSRLKMEGPALSLASIDRVTYYVHYELSNLQAESILGDIAYSLEGTGLDIEPINLDDLPDFLDDPKTDLGIANPQIYLNLFNPVGSYGLGYQSSLDIIAIREDEKDKAFTSPEIKVPGSEGYFQYLLAPNPGRVNNIPESYNTPGLDRLTYNNLGNILSGEGLPSKLDISLIDPEIPQQTLKSPFLLNSEIEGMHGEYMFLAPLALSDGSTIVKTVDGWWSEDLADLNIDYLTITADATNGMPTGVIINVYAINQEGEQISTVGSLKLDADAVNSPIEIKLEGLDNKPFNNLDGVKLYVIAANNTDEPLAPEQTIILENLKGKVTGNYTRKL